MSGVVDGLWKGLAVSAKVVIGAVSALCDHGKKLTMDGWCKVSPGARVSIYEQDRTLPQALLQGCMLRKVHKKKKATRANNTLYLVADTVNIAVASVTDNTILRGLIDLDIDLSRV